LLPAVKSEKQPADSAATIVRKIRDTYYHPERFLNGNNERQIQEAIDEKRHWISTPKTSLNARQRHQMIKQANATMQTSVAPIRNKLQHQLEQQTKTERAMTVIRSRDLAFVLHSRERLQDFFGV
jgi:hypothetical protein